MEGLRLVQWPNAIGFVISILLSLLDYNGASQHAVKIGLGISVTLRYLFGNCDFSSYPETPEAPFKSGHQVIWSQKFHNEVHVYYPIDKNTEITKEKDANWLTHGEKTIRGMLMLITGNYYSENEYSN